MATRSSGSCPENPSMDGGAWRYSPWRHKQSDMTGAAEHTVCYREGTDSEPWGPGRPERKVAGGVGVTGADAHLICLLPLSSVFTVFSLKNKNKTKKTKRWGKETTKRTKRKNPAQNQRWILFRIFFLFFYLPMARIWDTSAQRILSLTFPAAHNLQAARGPVIADYTHRTPRPHSSRLTWPGGTLLHWSCRSSQALRKWPEALGGMDRLVRGRSHWVFMSLGTSGDQCSLHPPPPRCRSPPFCVGLSPVRVPSLPPRRDLEEWGGEAVGLGESS